MKVLMYGWEFPPYISGGLGIACHAIVHALAGKHVDINLILPQAFETITENPHIKIIGCDFLKQFKNKKWLNDLKLRSEWDLLLNPYSSCEFSQYTNSWLSKIQKQATARGRLMRIDNKYGQNLMSEVYRYSLLAGAFAEAIPHDCIHCHDWLTVLAGVEAKQRSGKPLIFQVHALEPDRNGEFVNQNVYDIEKYGLDNADKIIAVSHYTKNIIIKRYGIAPEKIAVAHNGAKIPTIAHEAVSFKKPPFKTVLFLGRITHQKGPYFFVEIAKKILKHRKDIHFVMGGKGNYMKQTIEQVAHARIGQYFHFTGFIHPNKISHLYKRADVYVMPSVSEPFGLTCLEAAAHKIPSVISKQSGVSEVMPHVLKADFWDVNKMASKILALLDRPTLRQTITENAYNDLEYVSWDRSAEKILAVYQEALAS